MTKWLFGGCLVLLVGCGVDRDRLNAGLAGWTAGWLATTPPPALYYPVAPTSCVTSCYYDQCWTRCR